jgi:hypothetical protein
MRHWIALLLPLTLAACAGQSTRPAPVTENTTGEEPQQEEVKTYGYMDSGYGGFGGSSNTAPLPNGQPVQPVQAAVIREQAPPDQASSTTVLALIQTAEGQERAGNLAGAAATLERALRVQPRNAVLWHRLANVRFQQGQYARANSLAGKSNALAASNASLRRNNWLLIAKIKRAQGDEYGAREAEMKAAGGG